MGFYPPSSNAENRTPNTERRIPASGFGLPRPAVAESNQENVRVAVIVADDTVPDRPQEPVLGKPRGKRERNQGGDRHRDILGSGGHQMPAIDKDIGADPEANRNALVEKRVDRPDLGRKSTAPGNLRIALINGRGSPIEVGH